MDSISIMECLINLQGLPRLWLLNAVKNQLLEARDEHFIDPEDEAPNHQDSALKKHVGGRLLCLCVNDKVEQAEVDSPQRHQPTASVQSQSFLLRSSNTRIPLPGMPTIVGMSRQYPFVYRYGVSRLFFLIEGTGGYTHRDFTQVRAPSLWDNTLLLLMIYVYVESTRVQTFDWSRKRLKKFPYLLPQWCLL